MTRPVRCSRAIPTTPSFGEQVAFWHATEPARSFTCDRGEFVGRNRALSRPAALWRERCPAASARGSIRAPRCRSAIELEPGETRRVAFVLGQGRDAAHATELAARYTAIAHVRGRARRERTLLGRHAGRNPGQDAGRLVRSDRQSLAALSDAELPHLGAQRAVSARRRVRLPRSAAGCARAALHAAGSLPRAPAPRRVAAVRRG